MNNQINARQTMTLSDINDAVSGKRYSLREWKNEGTVQAEILLIHGLGEHSGRYEELGEYFSHKGFHVKAPDLPGHGLSEGKRGHISSPAEVFRLMDMILSASNQECPQFLYGHSLGGLLACAYLLQNPGYFQGAIISSPWLKLVNPPSFIQLIKAKAGDLLIPSMTEPSDIDPEDISTIPEEVEKYRSDQLNHGYISGRLFMIAQRLIKEVIKHANHIKVPTLFMHGTADDLTDPVATSQLAVLAENFELKLWKGMKHEPHHDQVKDDMFNFIYEWITSKTDT